MSFSCYFLQIWGVYKKAICRLQEEKDKHLNKISELEAKLQFRDVYNECALGGVYNETISKLQDQLIQAGRQIFDRSWREGWTCS